MDEKIKYEERWVNVSPDIARKYLERFEVNRTSKTANVYKLAYAMKSGTFRGDNGDAIRFDWHGKGIDGEHRLKAIIESDTTQKMKVIWGLDPAVVTTIDIGATRSHADSMVIVGADKSIYNNKTMSMARLHLRTMRGYRTVPNEAIDEVLTEYTPQIIAINRMRIETRNVGGINVNQAPLYLAYVYALRCGVNENDLRRFIQVLRTGFYNSEKEMAAIVLRNDIIEKRIESIGIGGDGSKKALLTMAEKAIFDFVNGVQRKMSYKNQKEHIYALSEKNCVGPRSGELNVTESKVYENIREQNK